MNISTYFYIFPWCPLLSSNTVESMFPWVSGNKLFLFPKGRHEQMYRYRKYHFLIKKTKIGNVLCKWEVLQKSSSLNGRAIKEKKKYIFFFLFYYYSNRFYCSTQNTPNI